LNPVVNGRSCSFGPLLVHYDERVLTPRPWTFLQSEWAAEICGDAESKLILELCAGAGQIGLAAAVLADCDLVQVEADPVAASYARANAVQAGRSERVEVRNTRLEHALGPDERFAIIIADPPYLRSTEISRWPDDPPRAIDGGIDGLDLLNACLEVAALHLTDAGRLLLQIAGPAQDRQITELLGATPGWSLTRQDARVVDDERAIMLIGRAGG
jgi:release factor glutamine methyltransferase